MEACHGRKQSEALSMVPAMVLIILVNSVPKAPYVSMAHAISWNLRWWRAISGSYLLCLRLVAMLEVSPEWPYLLT